MTPEDFYQLEYLRQHKARLEKVLEQNDATNRLTFNEKSRTERRLAALSVEIGSMTDVLWAEGGLDV